MDRRTVLDETKEGILDSLDLEQDAEYVQGIEGAYQTYKAIFEMDGIVSAEPVTVPNGTDDMKEGAKQFSTILLAALLDAGLFDEGNSIQ